MNAVQITTFALLVAAVTLRATSWARVQSRPLTLALALLALTLVLRLPTVNGWANGIVVDVSGWNNLPQLAANLIRLTAMLYLVTHVFGATGLAHHVPKLRPIGATLGIVLVATYALSEAPYLDALPDGQLSDPMLWHWVAVRVIAVTAHALMFAAIFLAIQRTAWRDRAVLTCYQFAAFAGILSGLDNIIKAFTGNGFQLPGALNLSYLCLMAYAAGSIANSYFKRTAPLPTHERIESHGVG